MKKLILVMGFPGSGKTTYTKELVQMGYTNINRDMFDQPGKVCSSTDFHDIHLRKLMETKGVSRIVVDNTYPDIASRKKAIDLAKELGWEIECWWLRTSIEDTQFNVAKRMIERYGKLITADDKKNDPAVAADSNMFPASVLFAQAKRLEEPTLEEGFNFIKHLQFERSVDNGYVNKAVILDYDGTLRKTKDGAICPNSPDNIEILENRKEILQKYKDDGYILLGVSNQSGIARGHASEEDIMACFEKTNELLGFDIDYAYCPHNVPINCYCRKPMPGLGVRFIEKYKLDASQCIMVGDMTSDKTFAKRCGFQYMDQEEFFAYDTTSVSETT